jgi:hypothetical protein
MITEFQTSEISWQITEDDVVINIRVPKARWFAELLSDFQDHEPFWIENLRRIQARTLHLDDRSLPTMLSD